jgi:hypothetical protein
MHRFSPYLCSLIVIGGLSAESIPVIIEPLWFRAQAISAPLPHVGEQVGPGTASVRVVLEAEVDPLGKIVRVTALDHGAQPFLAASLAALNGWSFQPFHAVFRNGQVRNRIGRIVFYFKNGGGTTTVVDAAAVRLAEERIRKRSKQ